MPFDLAVLVGGAFLAAFAVGAAGFADALIASAIWLFVLEPAQAVPLIAAAGIVNHVMTLTKLRRTLRFDLLWPLLIGGAVGVPLGAWLLKHVEPDIFRAALGVMLIAFSAYALARPFAGAVLRAGRTADGAIGLAGGVMGGFAGLCGVVPTIWTGMRGWAKEDRRGVYQPFILAMHVMTLGWLGGAGFLDGGVGRNFLWCLPALAAGSLLGLRLYGRLDENRFRRIVSGLLLVSGILLLI